MHLRRLVAVILLALLSGALTSGGVQAQKPASLTRHALKNAPFKGACDGEWDGRLHDGAMVDGQRSVLVRAGNLALGNLDGRAGRDGAVVLRCTTDFMYPDAVALYTAGRGGRAVFRGLVDLSSLGGARSGDLEQAYALAIRGRAVTVRWIHPDYSWSEGTQVLRPMSAVLALKRGRARVVEVRGAGAPDVAARFAKAMLHRRWKAARAVATADAVADLKDAPASSWKARPYCMLVEDEDESDQAECNLHEASVVVAYDDTRRRWTVTGGYLWN